MNRVKIKLIGFSNNTQLELINFTLLLFLINPIYTKIVKKELIDTLSDSFFMSIFQEYIPKKREYRVLYFDGKCFTVEILSQENKHSVIDSKLQENKDKVLVIYKIQL